MIDTNRKNTSTIQFQESEQNEPQRKIPVIQAFQPCMLEQDEKSASPVAPLWEGNKKLKNFSTVHKVQKKWWHWIICSIWYKRWIYTFCCFQHSVYSCLNCSSGMCFLSKQSYKGKRNSLSDDKLRRNFATTNKTYWFKVTLPCNHWKC